MTASLWFELLWLAAGGVAILGLVRWWRPEMSWGRGGAYLLLTLLFFAPAFARGGFQLATDLAAQWLPWRETVPRVAPQNPLLADPVLQLLPLRGLLRERLLHGEAPLWIDELGTGQPLLGNALLMPFFVLTVGLPPLQALTVAAAWQVFLALLLTHLLLRRLGASQAGATLAALAFAFSLYSIVWLYYPLSTTACWLPGVLLGLLLLRDRAPGGTAGLVVCGCGMALGGHPETLAHAALAALAVGVWLLAAAAGRRRELGGGMAAAAALVGCLTAPALLPIAESILGSERLAQLERSPDAVAAPAFEARSLALLVDPLAWGSPRDGNWSGPSNFNETATGYAGLLVLSLAAAGALCIRRRVAAIAGGGAVALLIALRVPPFGALLAPFVIFQHAANARLRFVWVLAIAVAAGLTVDRLLVDRRLRGIAAAAITLAEVLLVLHPPPAEAPWERAWWLATLAGAASFLVALVVPAARRWLPAAACCLAALDLALLGVRYNPTPGADFALAPPPALAAMLREARPERPPPRVAALGWDLMPNLAALYGLGDPRGNDPTRPAAAARFVGERLGGRYDPGGQVRIPERWFDQGALDYLGVRFLLTRHRREMPPPWLPVFDGPGGRVWENPGALPLFFFPRRCEVVPAESALPRALATPDFRAVGLVEGGGACALAQQGEVTARRRVSGDYEIAVSSVAGGLVVSSISSAPGWTAAAERQRLDVLRVNGAFLGFEVPPGRWQVRLRYQPLGWRVGWALAAAGALAALGLAWRARRREEPAMLLTASYLPP
jgi:Bacterial membrane protein YfhO